MFRVIILGTIPFPGEMFRRWWFCIPPHESPGRRWGSTFWCPPLPRPSAYSFSDCYFPCRVAPTGNSGESLSVGLAVFLSLLQTWGSAPDCSWIWKPIRGLYHVLLLLISPPPRFAKGLADCLAPPSFSCQRRGSVISLEWEWGLGEPSLLEHFSFLILSALLFNMFVH